MLKKPDSLLPTRRPAVERTLKLLLSLSLFAATGTLSWTQTVFLDFNSAGQYTSNFSPWNDNGGVNAANYSFGESTTNGVGGSGGVAVLQNNDTTVTYSRGSWDLSTNGANAIVSVLLYADGQTGGQVQLGFVNSTNNGLNSNPGVAFESFRFIATTPTTWPVGEQYRTGSTTFSPRPLGTVTVTVGHWYKFVVGVTNTSTASGNMIAGCALLDYGTDGLTPGGNLISFSTAVSNNVQDLTTGTSAWPALRVFDYGGISAWDNFLVFQPNSPPVFDLSFSNSVVATGTSPTFTAQADGPGTITYAWYTNNILVSGASGPSYTLPPLGAGFINVMEVASNSNGSTTNSATVKVVVAGPPQIVSVAATNVQTSSATLGGQVLSTGGVTTTAFLYYGTTDGGTNSGAWAQNILLGSQTGAFSQAVTALAAGTAYFFTVQASNAFGVVWATPSQSFATPAITLPQVTNASASSIGVNLATLNGRVLSTGGEPPTVVLYYGPADGGTNAVAWSKSVSLGLQSGTFAQSVGSLSSNTTYYFTAKAVNSAGTAWATPSKSFTTLAAIPGYAVLTYHNDNTRQGANTNEMILTPANVNTNSFGRLFSYAVDGFVYAQPLIMTNVSIPGKGTHNVVYVATEHNSVYAFDADDNSGVNGPLWQISFLGPGVTTVPSGDVGTTDITPEIGITSTPVIDPVTGTIYCEVKTKEGTGYVHRLHALDIRTGLERTDFNSPGIISCANYPGLGTGDNDGQNPPHVLWDPLHEHCRPALTLLNGAVYLSFASHGDNQPYHGWMFAYNATNVTQQLGVYNATPNGGLGGFWDGGGGPSVDAQGNLYFQTGNGTFDGGTDVTTTNNYAMSLMKLATTNGIALVDYFAPANAVALSDGDQDLGSSAPIILPDSAGSVAHPHLVVGGGKTAPIYLVDRDKMGRFNGTSGPNKIIQQFNGGPGGDRDTTPAFFNNTLYIIDSNSRIGAYSITNAQFKTIPVETPDGFDNKGGATVSISANGTGNAIAWVIYNAGGQSPSTPCILRAYNATNLTQELYTSDQVASRDSAGDAVKFTAPTIANGKVYVGAQYSLTVYGLAAAFLNTPVISPNGGIFTNAVAVRIADSSPGTKIYYTLDGTPPSTNSILYTGPFILTNSAAVQAFAVKTGAVSSGIASAGFLNSSVIGSGTGLLGQYFASQLMTFVPPPTLVRTDAVVNFNWNTVSPNPSIPTTDYTVRWTGMVQPQFDETYTFSTTTDDGVRLWVNGQLIIDEWVDQAPTTWTGTIALQAQQYYNIQMDYYQNQGGAVASLSWSSPSTPLEVIPTTQLYPVTNPPPVVVVTGPANGASYTASASVTISANAAAQYNAIREVDFYANNIFLGTVSNVPYALTATGLGQGSYNLVAVAQDTTGLAGTSAPVSINVSAGTGLTYGLTVRSSVPAFLNMPASFYSTLPAKLSLTGAFANTPSLTPVPGLIPYVPNTPLWSDGAVKTRWMAVPYNGSPNTPDEQITYAATGEWEFPSGTVFVKNFDLVVDETNTNTPLRRLETRLLVRDPNGSVYGVTYRWRPDNSDADLLTDSLSEDIMITNAAGVRTQTWYYPSPTDCLMCHTPAANYVLGVKTRQLNGNYAYAGSGVSDNQLRTLNHLGMFNPAIDEATIPSLSQLVPLNNQSASLENRSRSYIDANCAQCHRPGGTGITFDARYDTPLTNQNIINATAVFNLGYDNAHVITPKDLWRSMLYQRADSLDPFIKMPPLARNLVDTNAIAVIAAWINSLPGTPALAPPSINPAGGTFNGSVLVGLQHTNPQAVLYFTLDGTLPTTNSLLYSTPFVLTNSAIVSANAFATGYNNSITASDPFTILPGMLFTGSGYLSNGVFAVGFSGTIGKTYVLQGSTDFKNWVPLSTNVPVSSPFTVSDPQAGTYLYRFYRTVQLP
jgi:uncharacterized repeat protein (TIGR03806 family)